MYVGIDVAESETHVAVVDEDGDLVETARIATEHVAELAVEYDGHEAALDASASDDPYAVYEELTRHLSVTLVDPAETRSLAETVGETDPLDARTLAELLCGDRVAERYVPSETVRRHRTLARNRRAIRAQRTEFEGRLAELLAGHGIDYAALAGTDGRSVEDLSLPPSDQLLAEQLASVVDSFDERLTEIDREIATIAERTREVELLASASGITLPRALAIYAEIGDVSRFDSPTDLVCYAGLAESSRPAHEGPTATPLGDGGNVSPRATAGAGDGAPLRADGGGAGPNLVEFQAGTGDVESPDGPELLREAVLEAVDAAVHDDEDPYLRESYDRVRGRGEPHEAAMAATARRLLESLYHMLRDEERYDPPAFVFG